MSQRYIGGLIYNPPGGFSGYFDGSGDYLTIADNAAFQMGSGAFTIECWFFGPSFASNQSLVTKWADGQTDANAAWGLDLTSGVIRGILASSTTVTTWTGPAPATNAWNHAAFVRDGSNNVSLFLNGNRVATATYSSSINNGANAVNVGSANGNNRTFTGYISNARVVKGTAVYDPTQTTYIVPNGPLQAITNTSLLTCAYPTFRDGSSNNFTITVNGNTAVSTQNPFPLTQLPNPALGNQGNGVYSMSQYQALRSQNLWPAIDPYFDYVTLMLHGNGTNGAQNNTFLDSSTNNFTITRNGNTTQGTFTPYGSNWSNYFASVSDYLGFTTVSLGASYTIEFLAFFPSAPSSQNIVISNAAGGGGTNWIGINASAITFSYGGTNRTFSFSPAGGVWYYIQIISSSSSVSCYVNGSQVGTAQTGPSSFSVDRIGGYSGNGFVGYLSNVRVVNSALSVSATPTAPLTAITNTSLLTCQSNRFIDNSSNAFVLTATGSPSVQRFSPFNPTTPYAADVIGGSGYFDGSGDYLTTPSNAALNLSGDFTVEAWVYPTSLGGAKQILTTRASAATASSTAWSLAFSGTSLIWFTTTTNISGGTAIANAWNYIAAVRSGSTITLYLNGVSVGTATLANNFTDQTLYVGACGNGDEPIVGYIAGARVLKGTAATITVPAAPPTAITNTSLLLNFTNGGIIDNAMMNDLETVGNAQISTSVSKFGGGSLAFDGNGDALALPANINLAVGGGDFTIEMWVNGANNGSTVGGSYPRLFTFGTAQTSGCIECYNAAGTMYIEIFGVSSITFTASTLLNSTWNHYAITRSGTSLRAFVNGTQVGTTATNSTNINLAATTQSWIGAISASAGNFNGYIDDLRITKGYARYTTNFTPQRSQWQDQ